MNHPHVETRGTVLCYRSKIPADLLPINGGSREIRHSLKTRHQKAAVRLARLRSVEFDTEFEIRRRELAAVSALAATPTEIGWNAQSGEGGT